MKKNPTLVITGAAGQLGSALVERLSREKYTIICLIKEHHRTDYLEKLNVQKIIPCDLKDPKTYAKHIPENAIIFHCYSLSPGANATLQKYMQENALATKILLDVAKQKKVQQVIYMSSCSVIGPKATPGHSISEDDPVAPNEPYGKSKLEAEKEVQTFHQETKIPSLILRIFPLYGPYAHLNSTPIRICKLLQKKRFFMVGNGNNYYEFCYTKNAAEGIYLAFQKLKMGIHVLNISEPIKRTYNEVIHEIAKYVNPNVKIVRIPVPLALLIGYGGEMAFKLFHKRTITRLRTVQGLIGGWTSDCTKQVQLLDYKQPYTLEQGVAEFIQWAKEEKLV